MRNIVIFGYKNNSNTHKRILTLLRQMGFALITSLLSMYLIYLSAFKVHTSPKSYVEIIPTPT